MNVIDLSVMAAFRIAAKTIAEIEGDARAALDDLTRVDVSKLSGRELEKIRDSVQQFRMILTVCSPACRARIEAEAVARGRALTDDETITVLAPFADQWRVTFG